MINSIIKINSIYCRWIVFSVMSFLMMTGNGYGMHNPIIPVDWVTSNVTNSCGLGVDAGSDHELCSPGGSVQLNGYVNNSAYSFSWSPTAPLNDPDILDPIATVNQTTTFILEAMGQGPNLIVNPNFDQGNFGFSSEYTYSPTNLIPEGTYAIVESPASVHPSFQDCSDHTPGPGGNMMVVNGAGATNVNVWCQTINNITPNRDYEFSAWLTSVISASPAELQFSINGQLLGNTFNASSNTCDWDNFFEIWNSGSATSATICIVNQNTALGGNDFALDDIEFHEICFQRDSVIVEVTPPIEETVDTAICAGDMIEIGGQTLDQEGTHEITLQTATGCDSILTVNLEVLDAQAYIHPPDTLNCNNTMVTLDGSASTGEGILTYVWGTSDGNFVDIPSGPYVDVDLNGTYSLTVWAEDYGILCPSLPYEVYVPLDTMTPFISISEPEDLKCLPDTVELEGNIDPPNGNYLINWTSNNGNIVEGGESLTPLVDKPGVYELTVEQLDNGCSVTKSVVLKPDTSVVSAMINDFDTFNCELDTITLSAIQPGSTAVNYTWSTNDGNILGSTDSSEIIINEPGSYQLIVHGSDNCVDSTTVLVPIDTIRPVFRLSKPETLTCRVPQDTIFIEDYNSLPPSDVVWGSDPRALKFIDETDSFIVIGESGKYFVRLTSEKNACSFYDTVEVFENKMPPDVTILPVDTLRCISDTVTVLTSVQDSNLSYSWSSIKGIVPSNDTSSSLKVSSPAWYFLETTDSLNGCASIDSVYVPEKKSNLFQALTTSAETINCTHPEVELLITGIAEFNNLQISGTGPGGDIDFLNSDSTIIISSGGKYKIIVKDTVTGCEKEDSIVIKENFTSPVANANEDDTLNCFTSSVLLDARLSVGDSLKYEWYDLSDSGDLLSTSPTYKAVSAGYYILKLTDLQNGCMDRDTVRVFPNPNIPRIQMEEFGDITCRDSIVTLDASSSEKGPGIQPLWTSPDAMISSDSLSYVLEISQSGTYIFKLENEENGCIAIDSFYIEMDTLSPRAYLPSKDSLTCIEEEVELSLTPETTGDYQFKWFSDSQGSIISDSTSASILVDRAGTHTVELYDETNGCSRQYSSRVIWDTLPPIAHAGNDQLLPCEPKMVELDGFASSIGDQYSYQWYNMNGHELTNADSVSAVTYYPGIHTLQVTNRINGCTNIDTMIVSKAPAFPVQFNIVHENCHGKGEVSLAQHLFEDTAIGRIPGIGEIGFGETLTDLPAGVYQLSITNRYGCVTDTSFRILNSEGISIRLPSSISLTLGETHQIIPELNFADSLIRFIEWTPGEHLDCSSCLRPYITAWEDRDVTLHITDVNGCTAEATIEIKVDNNIPIYIPNAFTPNSDGINDVFKLYGSDLIQRILTFNIYNRWGELIYSERNIDPNSPHASWDGRFKGDKLSPAVFVFYIELELKNGDRRTFSGDVSLLK